MPPDPWVAIDTPSLSMVRAKPLRDAWEEFLGDAALEGLRAPIGASWQRSHAAGVDPSGGRVAPALVGADETPARLRAHPLAAAVALVRDCLGPIAAETGQLIVVSDANGMLLWIDGPPGVRGDAAESMNFTEVVQESTCSAAPVHDPDTGRILGVIDLTGKLGAVHPYSFGCVVATARAVDSHLRYLMGERDARLRARYEDRIAAAAPRASLVMRSGRVISGDPAVSWIGADRIAVPASGGELTLPSGERAVAEPVEDEEAFVVRALDARNAAARRPLLKLTLLRRGEPCIELEGRPLRLSPIRTEILALLSARREGMTSEELAADLYGDVGRPSAVRVQVFRLRKLLGQWIDTAPYRLSIDVESDVAQVCALLARGAVREAAERYEAPLLPHSEAPGVIRERDGLEGWLRHAVMTSGDTEALWAWTQSSSGCDDLAAWKRLLADLDYCDPRRSLAASRVGSLRAAYGVEATSSARR
jgi:hypothetical protein